MYTLNVTLTSLDCRELSIDPQAPVGPGPLYRALSQWSFPRMWRVHTPPLLPASRRVSWCCSWLRLRLLYSSVPWVGGSLLVCRCRVPAPPTRSPHPGASHVLSSGCGSRHSPPKRRLLFCSSDSCSVSVPSPRSITRSFIRLWELSLSPEDKTPLLSRSPHPGASHVHSSGFFRLQCS